MPASYVDSTDLVPVRSSRSRAATSEADQKTVRCFERIKQDIASRGCDCVVVTGEDDLVLSTWLDRESKSWKVGANGSVVQDSPSFLGAWGTLQEIVAHHRRSKS